MNKFIKKIKMWGYYVVGITVFASIIFSAVYVAWWRCGEMFPNAQLACFIGSK